MIARDIQAVDIHPDHWINLVRGPPGTPRRPGKGWLVMVHERERVIHAIYRGRPVDALLGEPPGDLAGLRRRFGAGRVVCLERDFLRRAMTRAEARLSYEMDYVEQVMTYVAAFRAERGTGIRVHPPTPPGPLPPFSWLQFAFDRLWPDDSSMLLYVIDEPGGRLHTSLIVRKRGGHLDLLTTDLHFGHRGLDPAGWRSDRHRVLRLARERAGKVYAACFATLDAWQDMRQHRFAPAALARLRRDHELVLDPHPRRLAVLWATIHHLLRLAKTLRRRGGY